MNLFYAILSFQPHLFIHDMLSDIPYREGKLIDAMIIIFIFDVFDNVRRVKSIHRTVYSQYQRNIVKLQRLYFFSNRGIQLSAVYFVLIQNKQKDL